MTSGRTLPDFARVPFSGHWRRWSLLAAPLLLVGLILIFFWKLAFSGLILPRGDTFLYFYPYWQAAADALSQGRVPLWNSQIFMGAPFVANSQVGYFYPLNWPFWFFLPVPYAFSASILVHLTLTAVGTYLLGRKHFALSVAASILAAVVFALGGYVTAQVEHINQLQVLAWIPWLLLAAGGNGQGRINGRGYLSGVLVVTLQLLAGHTQTLFIALTALLTFRVAKENVPTVRYVPTASPRPRSRWRALSVAVAIPLALAAGAAVLGAVQLLPTLELMQHSGRQGGLPLNEAVSFSLHPLLLPQTLLPHIGRSLFTEYVAFVPITVLLLAAAAMYQWRSVAVRTALALVAGGFFLALGRFNPLYLLLAQLPGLNYFRAPARWMVLYALGIALLAGLGLDLLRGVRQGYVRRRVNTFVQWGVGLVIALILLAYAAGPLSQLVPTGAEAPVQAPDWWQTGLWAAELVVAYGITQLLPPAPGMRRQVFVMATLVVVLVVQFGASRSLPYNRLSTVDAYQDLRPPLARLKALQNCIIPSQACAPAPARFLSLSNIFFDPGDVAELVSIYEDRLSEGAFYDYIIAVKQKEIIAPNLPMAYGLASVDGFDGGVLPLRDYATLMRLVLGEEAFASDGRLREYLESVPDARWLDLFGARYLITDKVGDEWRRGVFFDVQHARDMAAAVEISAGYLPDYEATEVWVLGEIAGGTITVTASGGVPRTLPLEPLEDGLWRAVWPEPIRLEALSVTSAEKSWHLRGLALVDSRDGTFHSIIPGNYRLIYSGDVKIYENLDVLPRAFLVGSWQWQPDARASVEAMAAPDFDPRTEAVIAGNGENVKPTSPLTGQAEIVSYEPEEIVVRTVVEEPALLLLTGANYPGWEAQVDGDAAHIYQVDALFRGVFVPAGSREVRFQFHSSSYNLGRWVTIFAVFLWIALVVWLSRHSMRPQENP